MLKEAPASILKAPVARPGMVFQHRKVDSYYPFSSPSIHYYYFARNAIWHAVHLLNLTGKEVLVPAYHHGVEIEALVDAGALVRFFRVDIDMNPDLEDIERKITTQTAAIYLIHYLGFPGPTREIKRLAEANRLVWMEDCALALLSADKNRLLGTTADASFFCFYKTLPIPHGGALVFNRDIPYPPPAPTPPSLDSTLSHFAASLLLANPDWGRMGRNIHRLLQPAGKAVFSTTARLPRVDPGTMHFERENVNLGMSRLAQHLLGAQDFGRIVERRRKNYTILLEELARHVPPVFNRLPDGVCPLFYPLRVDDKDRMRRLLEERNIETIDFWRTGHPACYDAEFPDVAELRRTIVELPCHQDLTEEMIRRMASEVQDILYC